MFKIKIVPIIYLIISIEIYSQVPIQFYDFENNSARPTGETSVEFIVNTLSGSTISSSDAALTSVSGNPSSGSAQQRSSWSTMAGDPGVTATSYIQFNVNTSGFSGISVGIDAVSSLALLNNVALIYSTDGTTFTSAGSKSLTTSYTTLTWDVSAVTSLDNASSITFRLYAYGTAITTGAETLTIDNLTIYAKTITSTKTLPDFSAIDNANGSSPFPAFTDFTINGSGITATLSSNVELNGTLTLTSGKIITTSSYNIIMDSTGAISGGSSGSYINGNLKWIYTYNGLTVQNLFPIGTSTAFREIDITIFGQLSAGSITAKVTDSNPGFNGSLPTGVNSISIVRYWTITIGDGFTFDAVGTIGAKIYWGSDDGVSDKSTLTVVKGTAGGNWTSESNTGSSGTSSSGWVLGSFSSPVSSDFVLGDKGTNPLPVQLYSFTSSLTGEKDVQLNWTTATELNSFKFEVERKNISAKQVSWEKIGEVSANGNSNSIKNYSFTDKYPGTGEFSYRLKTIDVNGSFEYSKGITIKVASPDDFQLAQNYPNPFNPSTTISYSLPVAGQITLKIYDTLGREITTLVNEFQEPGFHEAVFNASKLASGIYFYRIAIHSDRITFQGTAGINNFDSIKKMILLK